MAIGLDLDTEYANRVSIPSGAAGTLSAGGFADCFVGVWLYRTSATATYALTAGGAIIHWQAGAREVSLGFNSAGANLVDLNLQIVYNSGGGAGTPATFSGHTGADFLDEWVYYFIYENAANDQVAGYIRLADLATAVTLSRANDNAGSQFINTLTFGNVSANNTVILGHYAYARARDSSPTASDVLAYANSDATIAGDWGFWPLADNTDTGDTSGNSRSLTFGGTLTSETSPAFSGSGPTINTQPVSTAGYVGGSVRLTALATASGGTLTAQWQDNSGGSFANISGETDVNGLTVSALTYAITGRQYKVIYTDSNGSVTSSTVTLTVNTVDVYLWDTSVQSGNDVWLRDPTQTAATGAYTMPAAQGSYTLTGTATGLRAGRIIAAAQGTYSLSGQAVTLLRMVTLVAAQGSYGLTGFSAATIAARRITAAQGTYALTGFTAGLVVGRRLAAAQGSYAITGNAVGIIAAHRIAAAQGSYGLTGFSAALIAARRITAAQGSYTLTGQDATLTYSAGARILVAAQGSYALTGFAAGLIAARRIAVAQGVYGITGFAAGTIAARKIAAAQGVYALAGQAAGLLAARRISIGAGGYTLTGNSANLLAAYRLAGGQGSYVLSGQATGLTYSPIVGSYQLPLVTGFYVLSGFAAGFSARFVVSGPRPGGPNDSGAPRATQSTGSRNPQSNTVRPSRANTTRPGSANTSRRSR